MFRVKETYTEAQALEAAASASHAMKNHKPIRCALAFEVTPLGTRARAGGGGARQRRADAAPRSRRDPARGDAPAPAWWEAGGAAAASAAGETSRRDLFVYVDTTSVGRRKDARVRVQLREDDLDIDARGSRAIVVAEAGDTSDARSSSSSDDEAEEEEERRRRPTPPTPTSPTSLRPAFRGRAEASVGRAVRPGRTCPPARPRVARGATRFACGSRLA